MDVQRVLVLDLQMVYTNIQRCENRSFSGGLSLKWDLNCVCVCCVVALVAHLFAIEHAAVLFRLCRLLYRRCVCVCVISLSLSLELRRSQREGETEKSARARACELSFTIVGCFLY